MAPRFLTILTGRNLPKIRQSRKAEPSDGLADRRRSLRRAVVAPPPFVPALAGKVVGFPDQRFVDLPLFVRTHSQDAGHRASLRDLPR
jgi:hypothetical protein